MTETVFFTLVFCSEYITFVKMNNLKTLQWLEAATDKISGK